MYLIQLGNTEPHTSRRERLPQLISFFNEPFIWYTSSALDSHSPTSLKWKKHSPPHEESLHLRLCASLGFFPRLSHTYLALPLKSGNRPRAQSVLQLLTPRAPVLVLQPPPPRLKRKKQSIMGNGVLHSKPQKRAKPTPPSPSIPGLVGDEPRGRGVLFFPSTCTPSFRTPKVLLEPKGQWWKRKGESFPARSPLPLNCTRVLGFSRVSPAPSPPTQPANSPHQSCPNEGLPLRLRPPARAIPARDLARARPSQVARAAIPHRPPLFPSPPGAPPHTLGGARHPSAQRTQRERSLSRKARGGREVRSGVQEINRGRESPPHPKRPRPARRGATSRPATTRGALRPLGPLSDALSLGKARPSAFNSPGKKPAPAHPARTGIRKRNPHPAKAKTPPSPSYPRAERSRHFPLFPASRSLLIKGAPPTRAGGVWC